MIPRDVFWGFSKGFSSAVTVQPISEAEIVASIPAEGTTIGKLLDIFKGRVGPDRNPFIALVKRNSTFDRVQKKLLPRPAAPGGGGATPGTSTPGAPR